MDAQKLLTGPAGPLLDAFTDVPRSFWAGVTIEALDGMIVCGGRLTFAEREHIWHLLGHLNGEPPRGMRIDFDPGRMQTDTERMLDALRRGGDAS